jgi:tRNA(Ile2) C34 agmatinyltransferase TiaS
MSLLNEEISRMKSIMGLIIESQDDNKVTCDKCGWSWKLSEGGDDTYTCHKCGNVNKANKEEITEKCWKGYEKKGMKTMFGKRYPNCVKKTKK